MALLRFTKKGIYCPEADVYIDPWKKVSKALITHGHSDHARYGHLSYLCSNDSVGVLKHRLGQNINVQGVSYGEAVHINGVRFSFHPAGHIIGSAQIRVEYKGEVWVVSGDYKVENDGISGEFEPVTCQHFITECTFGLPIYKWSPQSIVFEDINNWWEANKEEGAISIISAYSLGKAQRIIQNVDHSIGPIFTHSAVEGLNKVFRAGGFHIPDTTEITKKVKSKDLVGALVVSPSGSIPDHIAKSAKNIRMASASGWMMSRGMRRRGNFDKGFVLSDHADWHGLNTAIKETGAENIYPTHGYTRSFARWLTEEGYKAQIVETNFEGESLV